MNFIIKKCGFYKSCSCNESDYFYKALKTIRFDPRIILPVLYWETEEAYKFQDDETADPPIRYVQNKHPSFLLKYVHSPSYTPRECLVSNNTNNNFSLTEEVYGDMAPLMMQLVLMHADKDNEQSKLNQIVGNVLFPGCGFYDVIKEYFGDKNIELYSLENPKPQDFKPEKNNVMYTMLLSFKHK